MAHGASRSKGVGRECGAPDRHALVPHQLIERLSRLDVDGDGPDLDRIDPTDDAGIDELARYLLRRFHREDDVDALALLFEVAHARLVEIARSVVRRLALAADPDDLVMGFMTRLFTDVRRPQPEVHRFLGLARTAMRNDALNMIRSQSRARLRHEAYHSTLKTVADPIDDVEEPEHLESVARAGLCLIAVVGHCFHGLSTRDRRVLIAREVDELSYREIGERLELAENQVGTVLKRARRRLSERIASTLAGVERRVETETSITIGDVR